MKVVIPIVILLVTAALVVAGIFATGRPEASAGASGGAAAPQQAVAGFLQNVQHRNWDAAYAQLANSNFDKAAFVRDLGGSDASLRTFSTLTSWDLRPLHATNTEADIRATLQWSTPVGVLADVRDLKVVQQQGAWKVQWPEPQFPTVPSQVIPVNYLRWDVVSSSSAEEWGDRNVDGPHVRITSMNATAYQGGTVIMGEVVNEDTIPAFVNVNATLVGKDEKDIGQEGSFDKILHVLLPKQVTPYRIDFPDTDLPDVKNVRMDIKATLVPASADPVIGVMGQAIATDAQGRKVLKGQLLNQSGLVVNIPHVLAAFYDNSGRVVWVSDGYVDRALYPQAPEPFTVEIPNQFAGNVQNYHVVVNQYSLGRS